MKKENIIYVNKIAEYDVIITNLKDKISDLLKPSVEITTSSSYDTLLFSQMKDLQKEIDTYKQQYITITNEKETINKKYQELQNKMKSLLSL